MTADCSDKLTEISESYQKLALKLDQLPNGFPRTDSNIEIDILQKIFSPEDAELASHLTGTMEAPELIAQRADLSVKKATIKLLRLAKRRLVWMEGNKTKPTFRLAPFVVGIYEAQVESLDHELAHMIEDYMNQGGAEGIMRYEPALHRVVPAHGTVNPEWILPYDDVRSMLLNAKSFNVCDCICRKKMKLLDKGCDFPLKNCLSFFAQEKPPRPSTITKEEALALLDESKDVGLVHTVSNIAQGVFYLCNCCGCCCELLLGINEKGIEKSVARANYLAAIDDEQCDQCGLCQERCQVNAITEDVAMIVDAHKCIGCGVCVSACPNQAMTLKPIAQSDMVHPPQDFAAWERLRLQNRGMVE
jgi:H+/Na+-translocating ferredoxin:NAD+ oxidoreductase subunit B